MDALNEPSRVTFVVFGCDLAPDGSWGEEARRRCDKVVEMIDQGLAHKDSPVLVSAIGYTSKKYFVNKEFMAYAMRKYLLGKGVNAKLIGIVAGAVGETKRAIHYIRQHDLSKTVVMVVGSWDAMRGVTVLDRLTGHKLTASSGELSGMFAGHDWKFYFLPVRSSWVSCIKEMYNHLVYLFTQESVHSTCLICGEETIPMTSRVLTSNCVVWKQDGRCWICYDD